jgi:uncharacterized membrane protein
MLKKRKVVVEPKAKALDGSAVGLFKEIANSLDFSGVVLLVCLFLFAAAAINATVDLVWIHLSLLFVFSEVIYLTLPKYEKFEDLGFVALSKGLCFIFATSLYGVAMLVGMVTAVLIPNLLLLTSASGKSHAL